MDKEAMKKQFLDKSKIFNVVIDPKNSCGIDVVSQVFINISLDNTILDALKIYFEQLKIQAPNYFFDYRNIIKDMNVHVHAYGKNITNIDKKIKLYTFECTRPFLTVNFPDMVRLQLKASPNIYVFNSNDFIVEAEKFLKKNVGIDLSKFECENKNTIPMSEKFNAVFKSHGVNILFEKNTNANVITISERSFPTLTREINATENGSIYLIRTREFLNQKAHIFKIGKTSNNISERLGNYGKGGEVLFTIAVPLSKLDSIEVDLIKSFKNKFIQKQDIGTEYFEGNYLEMIRELYEKCFSLLIVI